MAIVWGASLGTGFAATSPNTTTAFNTTGTVSAGGRLFVGVSFYNAVTVSVGGGGLSWTQDGLWALGTDPNWQGAVYSAAAPAGLASGTTITATASGNAFAFSIAGGYATGVATSDFVEDTATSSADSAAWTTGTVDTAGSAILIAHAWLNATLGTATTTGPAVEFADFQHTTDNDTITMAYQIASGPQAALAVAGTWSGSQQWIAGVVAYNESTEFQAGGTATRPGRHRGRYPARDADWF